MRLITAKNLKELQRKLFSQYLQNVLYWLLVVTVIILGILSKGG